MNKETVSILKLAGVTATIFVLTGLSIKSTSSGVHIHDTYFIMSSTIKLILILVFSAFIGSLLASILSRFRNRLYNRILIFTAFLIFSSGVYIFSLLSKTH